MSAPAQLHLDGLVAGDAITDTLVLTGHLRRLSKLARILVERVTDGT